MLHYKHHTLPAYIACGVPTHHQQISQQITQATQYHENKKSRTLAIEVSTSATKKSANVIGCAKSENTKIVTDA